MPPQGRGRGGSAGGGAGRAGSAASADPGAGPSTSGRSGPASQLSILPAPLLEAYRALPAAAEALLPAPATQRPGGGSSAAGRGRGAGSGRLAALRGAKDRLWDFGLTVLELPNRSSPEQAAALAELLSTHPAETAALLRLYSAALRPDGEGEGSGGSGSGSGRGTGGGGSGSGGGGRGAGSSAAVEALAIKGWRAGAADCVVYVLGRLSPLPCSPHALSVLRFVLALLRTQALPALSRRLAAVTQAAAISEDSARDILRHAQTLLATLNGVLLTGAETSRAHSAEVASLHATCVEEWARSLAESGLLEHAARALLLLQARGLPTTAGSVHWALQLLHVLTFLRRLEPPGGLPWSLSAWPGSSEVAVFSTSSPTIVSHLRSVLGSRCLQTAVLVYGVSTLRLLDGGPSYGLPPALKTAGFALRAFDDNGALDSVALERLQCLLTQGNLPSPAGPLASLELLLRMSRAGAGAAAAALPAGLAPHVAAAVPAPPSFPHSHLPLRPADGARLAVLCLAGWRLRLTRRRVPPPRLAEWRQEWWRLATCTAVYGMRDAVGEVRELLWRVMSESVRTVWPDSRLDLDALPPAPPPEVAAALAAGLLPALAALPDLPRSGSVKPCSNPFEDLLNACDLVRPGGSGLALFLAPLLVYGEPGQAEGLLGALGRGLEAERGGGKGGPESPERLQRAAASLLGALAGALQRCRRLGPAAAEAPAGPAEDSGAWEAPEAGAGAGAAGDPSGAGLPSPLLQQLRRLVAYASEQWGLPLPVLDGAAGSSGGGAEGQGS